MNHDTELLWKRYHNQPSQELKRELSLTYTGLVKNVVNRFGWSRYFEQTALEQVDLLQFGYMGLLEAIDRFDPQRGVSFESYAINRIRGAIRDELRRLDWVPRSVRQKQKSVEREMNTAGTVEMEGLASVSAEESGADQQEYSRFVRERRVRLTSNPADGNESVVFDAMIDESAVNPFQQMVAQELRMKLIELIQALPDQERLVVTLYYYENLRIRDIAEILKLSESRISQIHRAVLKRLKEELNAEDQIVERKTTREAT